MLSYCREKHNAVLRSKENLPPDSSVSDSNSKDSEDSQNKDETLDSKDFKFKEEVSESNLIQKEEPVSGGKDQDARLVEQNASNGMAKDNSVDSPVIKEASNTKSSYDENFYRMYYIMNASLIRKKISDTPEQLTDVNNLLNMLIQKVDTQEISSQKYDVTLSDDEDIEKLEKAVINLDISDCKIKLSENVEESLKIKSSTEDKKVEKINTARGEALEAMMGPPKIEPQCELCYWKKRSFKTKSLQNFSEKYSNCEFVTDFLNIHNSLISF